MRLILTVLFAAAPLLAVADDEHVRVALLSEQAALVPGTTAWLGVRLAHAPHWHTYWINPGDSGLPTKLAWQLPAGFRARDIAWPAPQRIRVGDLYNFGYEGDVLLPVPIEIPADARPGAPAHVAVDVKYLVCHDECIPGKADLALDLPVAAAAGKTQSSTLFDAARAKQPEPVQWSGAAHIVGDAVELTLHAHDMPPVADAFVVERKLVNYAPPQIAQHGEDLTLRFEKSDYFVGAPAQVELVVRSPALARSISVPFSSSTR